MFSDRVRGSVGNEDQLLMIVDQQKHPNRVALHGDLIKCDWVPAPQSFSLIQGPKGMGEAFLLTVGASLLTVGAFLLTVKLLCLQSLKALIRRTFPL